MDISTQWLFSKRGLGLGGSGFGVGVGSGVGSGVGGGGGGTYGLYRFGVAVGVGVEDGGGTRVGVGVAVVSDVGVGDTHLPSAVQCPVATGVLSCAHCGSLLLSLACPVSSTSLGGVGVGPGVTGYSGPGVGVGQYPAALK